MGEVPLHVKTESRTSPPRVHPEYSRSNGLRVAHRAEVPRIREHVPPGHNSSPVPGAFWWS